MNVLNLEHISKTYGEKVISPVASIRVTKLESSVSMEQERPRFFEYWQVSRKPMKDRWLCRMAFVSHICRSILNFQRAQPFFLT